MSPVRIKLRRLQARVFHNDRRFRVLVAGRRFGKTFLAITELCRVVRGSYLPAGQADCVEATQRDYTSVLGGQAKRE